MLRPLLLASLSLCLAACDRTGRASAPAPTTTPPSSAPASSSSGPIVIGSVAPTATASVPASAVVPRAAPPLTDAEFGTLSTFLSEAGGKFPSDNYISNETSYLHVADGLAGKKGGAYIGVGPEQNFTYLAMLEPALAFVIDIRRDNLVLHLLYKTLFEASATRAEFLAALTSRPPPSALAADATVEQITAAVQAAAHDPAREAATRKQVTERAKALGLPLTVDDQKSLREALAAFGKQGLGIHYTMEGSARPYPPLSELLAMKDDHGQARSFLATDASYQRVRAMQRDNLVVPVVGDLAGDAALLRMAAELKKRTLPLRVFYVSNVEQYLFSPATTWKRWVRNVEAMPWTDDGVLVRVYFDQGKAHPQQRPGHRTTSLVRPARAFLERATHQGWKSWWEVATGE